MFSALQSNISIRPVVGYDSAKDTVNET